MIFKAKRPTIIENGTCHAVYSATGNDLYPVGLTCCEVTIGKLQSKHTFIVHLKYKKTCYWS